MEKQTHVRAQAIRKNFAKLKNVKGTTELRKSFGGYEPGGVFVYTPSVETRQQAASCGGSDSFSVTVSDGSGLHGVILPKDNS